MAGDHNLRTRALFVCQQGITMDDDEDDAVAP